MMDFLARQGVPEKRIGKLRSVLSTRSSKYLTYGTTALLIAQDLSQDELKQTQPELAAQGTHGHSAIP